MYGYDGTAVVKVMQEVPLRFKDPIVLLVCFKKQIIQYTALEIYLEKAEYPKSKHHLRYHTIIGILKPKKVEVRCQGNEIILKITGQKLLPLNVIFFIKQSLSGLRTAHNVP